MRLPDYSDFDLERCVSSGQVFRWSRLPSGAWLGAEGRFWFRLEGAELETNGEREDFERLFRLDMDAAQVRDDLLVRGPELTPYWNAMSGLRLLRPSDPVETLFSFLCTPNNHIPRIASMVRHLATYGPELATVEGQVLHRFPTVARIAEITEAELRAKGFGYRAATIPVVAQDIVRRGEEGYVESLKAMPYEAAREALLGFRGIGRKLADCICLFALHHTEATPIDTHIWQAATRLYFPDWRGTALTDRKYEAAAAFLRQRFGSLAGWAQQVLFYENVLNWRTR